MKRFFAFAGVDRPTFYTLAGRGFTVVSGVVTLFMVAQFLSHEEQGYYYTFSSLLAMQLLFELGMSYVVMQFASHEAAHLHWGDSGVMLGDAASLSRLRSLALLVFKWYAAISAIIVVVVLPAGWIMFANAPHQAEVHWRFAWSWLILSTALNVFILPLLALLEGCGKITEVSRMRMFQNVFGSALAWAALLNHGGLIALPAMNTGIALVALGWLVGSKLPFFRDLLKRAIPGETMHWRTEIWPFQWKIAVSSLSSYFSYHLFTPITFYFCGAVDAGRIGMSITATNALTTVAMAWMNTKAPRFGALVAKRDYATLDRLFNFVLSRSLTVIVLLGALLGVANLLLHAEANRLADRLLMPGAFFVLIAATVCNSVVYALSTYLRAHKEDPFMTLNLASAVVTSALSLVLVQAYGTMGIVCGYLAISVLVGLGWGSHIFAAKRRQWRGIAAA